MEEQLFGQSHAGWELAVLVLRPACGGNGGAANRDLSRAAGAASAFSSFLGLGDTGDRRPCFRPRAAPFNSITSHNHVPHLAPPPHWMRNYYFGVTFRRCTMWPACGARGAPASCGATFCDDSVAMQFPAMRFFCTILCSLIVTLMFEY